MKKPKRETFVKVEEKSKKIEGDYFATVTTYEQKEKPATKK